MIGKSHSSYGPVVREIYAYQPKWWARWTWPLVLGITIWSTVAAQTAFYHWTRRIDVVSDTPTENTETTVANSETSNKYKWELRPLSQRLMMSGGILASGTAMGIVFLSSRSRIVRRMSLVSRSAPFQQNLRPMQRTRKDIKKPDDFPFILVETIVNIGGKGKVFSKGDCELVSGRDTSGLVLKASEKNSFWLGLEDAMIQGTPVTHDNIGAVRQRLLETWGSKKNSKNGSGWISGPIVEHGP